MCMPHLPSPDLHPPTHTHTPISLIHPFPFSRGLRLYDCSPSPPWLAPLLASRQLLCLESLEVCLHSWLHLTTGSAGEHSYMHVRAIMHACVKERKYYTPHPLGL